MFFFKENKKFPYFPKLKRKKDYKIIALLTLLLFFSLVFLTQNKKQIKNEVSAKSKEVKILGATTIKKIKPSATPTSTLKIVNSTVFPTNIPPTSTPTTAISAPIPSSPPSPYTSPSPIPTQTPTQIPLPTPTASNAATPTPTSNDDDIIIRPPINPKTTIYPLPTNPIFPPEQ